MKWISNVLVCKDGTLMTAFANRLELRGPGWEPRRGSKARRDGVDCRTVPSASLAASKRLAGAVARVLEESPVSK